MLDGKKRMDVWVGDQFYANRANELDMLGCGWIFLLLLISERMNMI